MIIGFSAVGSSTIKPQSIKPLFTHDVTEQNKIETKFLMKHFLLVLDRIASFPKIKILPKQGYVIQSLINE